MYVAIELNPHDIETDAEIGRDLLAYGDPPVDPVTISTAGRRPRLSQIRPATAEFEISLTVRWGGPRGYAPDGDADKCGPPREMIQDHIFHPVKDSPRLAKLTCIRR